MSTLEGGNPDDRVSLDMLFPALRLKAGERSPVFRMIFSRKKMTKIAFGAVLKHSRRSFLPCLILG